MLQVYNLLKMNTGNELINSIKYSTQLCSRVSGYSRHAELESFNFSCSQQKKLNTSTFRCMLLVYFLFRLTLTKQKKSHCGYEYYVVTNLQKVIDSYRRND